MVSADKNERMSIQHLLARFEKIRLPGWPIVAIDAAAFRRVWAFHFPVMIVADMDGEIGFDLRQRGRYCFEWPVFRICAPLDRRPFFQATTCVSDNQDSARVGRADWKQAFTETGPCDVAADYMLTDGVGKCFEGTGAQTHLSGFAIDSDFGALLIGHDRAEALPVITDRRSPVIRDFGARPARRKHAGY